MTALRPVLGVLCGAAVAAIGALVLGEYEFTGTLPFLAGPLFGIAVGEVTAGVAATRSIPLAVLAAPLAFGGVVWAGWIDSSEGIEPMKGLVWVAAGLAAVFAAWRAIDLGRLPRVR